MNPLLATAALPSVSDPVLGVTVDAVARRVALSGDLDLAGVDTFTSVTALLTGAGRGPIVVDLHDLRFVDAAGLGALVALRAVLTRDGADLYLCRASHRVTRVFALTGLDALLSAVPAAV